jgi:hypothetical protein
MPDQSGYAVGWGALAPINGGLAQGTGRTEVKYRPPARRSRDRADGAGSLARVG